MRIAVLAADLDDARIAARYVGAVRGLSVDVTDEPPPLDVPVMYVVRDPRGVYVKHDPPGAVEAIRAMLSLDIHIEAAMAHRSAPGMSVRLEEMCEKPGEMCAQIWSALGIDLATAIVNKHMMTPTALKPWRGAIGVEAHNEIVRDCGHYLSKHGYPARPAVGVGDTVAGLLSGEIMPDALRACLDADPESARAMAMLRAEIVCAVEVCEQARKDLDQLMRALVDNVTAIGARSSSSEWERWLAVGELRATASIADSVNLMLNRMMRAVMRDQSEPSQ